jgi:putative monooxygenase
MTRHLAVVSLSRLLPVERGGGVRTYHMVTPGVGALTFVNGITEFDPGASLPLHHHNCDESVTVLEGSAVFVGEGAEHSLSPGDCTLVPAGVVHRFSNRGASALRILWVYGSATPTRTLAATGETFAIGSAEEAALGNRPNLRPLPRSEESPGAG